MTSSLASTRSEQVQIEFELWNLLVIALELNSSGVICVPLCVSAYCHYFKSNLCQGIRNKSICKLAYLSDNSKVMIGPYHKFHAKNGLFSFLYDSYFRRVICLATECITCLFLHMLCPFCIK